MTIGILEKFDLKKNFLFSHQVTHPNKRYRIDIWQMVSDISNILGSPFHEVLGAG